MKIEDIEKLINLMEKTSLTRLTYTAEGETLKLSKKKEYPAPAPMAPVAAGFPGMPAAAPVPAAAPAAPAPAVAPAEGTPAAPAAADDSVVEVKSTYVGTVSLHEEGSDKPYVTVGAKVKKGQCICQIEAMKMYNSIPAPESGEVISVDVENGSIVEFGTVIARIRKD